MRILTAALLGLVGLWPAAVPAADIGTTLTILPQLVASQVESDDKQVHQAGTFTLQIVSAAWELVPGIVVTASVLESKDNGLTWTVLAGLVAVTGPLGSPPHDALPSVTVSHPNAKGSRRIKVELGVSAPLLIGATVTADGTP